MRKLPPLKAIRHAFSSVRRYATVGVRFSLWWTAILAGLGLANALTNPAIPNLEGPGQLTPLEIASAVLGVIALSSIAVNWHRFILKDEDSRLPMRLDGTVWRYAGNSVLAVIMAVVPVLILAIALAFLPEIASVLLVPAALVAGTFWLALSMKLPAVALGRKDFGFKDALVSTQDNFWPLMSVFLVNAAVMLAAFFIIILIASAFAILSVAIGTIAGVILSMVFNVFYTLFFVSILSSLYGFFVEKRDF